MNTLTIILRKHSEDVLVGKITQDPTGETFFQIDRSYLERGPERPIVSLLWHSVRGEEETLKRLARTSDKIGRRGFLPSWFSGLLPEGALRQLVESELGPGRHGELAVLARLGLDLPGAVVAYDPEAERPGSLAPTDADGLIRFSLAGVQMKFAADLTRDRVTFPAEGMGGNYIAKTTSATVPLMVEAEHMAMSLARALGIDTVDFFVVHRDNVQGVPEEYLAAGEFVFVSRRFDRTDQTRVHMEDFAQIAEAIGDMKYTAGTYETCINIINRFSARPDLDVEQSFRRMINDILVGNADAHLKNWCFLHGEEGPRLSKAYDIVPHGSWGDNRLALRMAGQYKIDKVPLASLLRIADYVKFPRQKVEVIAREMVDGALETWPTIQAATEVAEKVKQALLGRLGTLQLVQDVRPLAQSQGWTPISIQNEVTLREKSSHLTSFHRP